MLLMLAFDVGVVFLGGFACVGLLSSFEAMTNLDKSPAKKPPQKVPAWDGRDAVLAGAILDCSFNLGSTAQGNPNSLIPFPVQNRTSNHITLRALKNAKLQRLAVNLFQLNGPLFAFKDSQILKVFGLVNRSMKATTRKRDEAAWASNECLALSAFGSGLRKLFRDKAVPQSLSDELNLDEAELNRLSIKVKGAQGGDDLDADERGSLLQTPPAKKAKREENEEERDDEEGNEDEDEEEDGEDDEEARPTKKKPSAKVVAESEKEEEEEEQTEDNKYEEARDEEEGEDED